jgi:hypothetical protein
MLNGRNQQNKKIKDEKSEQNIWQSSKFSQPMDFNRKADKYIG